MTIKISYKKKVKIREYNRRLNGKRLNLHQNALGLKRQDIAKDERLEKFFNEAIGIFKSVGFYLKKPFQKDDIELGELLGVNARTLQRIRNKNGFVPKPHLQEEILKLKKLADIRIKTKKLSIKIRKGNKITNVY